MAGRLHFLAGAGTTETGSRRFGYIDALRGIAACAVLLYHFEHSLVKNFPEPPLPGPLHWLFAHGYLGVEIFFVLSGFVISYGLLKAGVTPSFLGRFALRRSLRLDPLFWTAILIAYAMRRLQTGPVGTGTIGSEIGILALNGLYLDRIFDTVSIIGVVSWTLCMEVQLYLAYIVLVWLAQFMTRPIRNEGLARFLVFAPASAYSLLVAFGALPPPGRGLCVEFWYMFFLGVLASWVTFRQASLIWFVMGFFAVIAPALVRWDIRAPVAALAALNIVLVGRIGRLHDLLGWRWLQHLGRISYSLYLMHAVIGWPFLNACVRVVGGTPSLWQALALFGAATALSLLAAELAHYLVERPTLALSKRIVLQLGPGPDRRSLATDRVEVGRRLGRNCNPFEPHTRLHPERDAKQTA